MVAAIYLKYINGFLSLLRYNINGFFFFLFTGRVCPSGQTRGTHRRSSDYSNVEYQVPRLKKSKHSEG
jgi:hypothetical protein